MPRAELYTHCGAHLGSGLNPGLSSVSVGVDAEGSASAKLEPTGTAEALDAASAGRIAASEGEMGINNTDTKINRDMTIFLSLTIELNDFCLVILKQKIDYIATLDELIHHSQEIKHIATIRNICRHVLALGLLLNRIDV